MKRRQNTRNSVFNVRQWVSKKIPPMFDVWWLCKIQLYTNTHMLFGIWLNIDIGIYGIWPCQWYDVSDKNLLPNDHWPCLKCKFQVIKVEKDIRFSRLTFGIWANRKRRSRQQRNRAQILCFDSNGMHAVPGKKNSRTCSIYHFSYFGASAQC